MAHDSYEISERISQTDSRTETGQAETLARAIHEIAVGAEEEVGGGTGPVDEGALGRGESSLSRIDVEARRAEKFAKESGIWIPMEDHPIMAKCRKTGGRTKGTPNKSTTLGKEFIVQLLSQYADSGLMHPTSSCP